LKARYDHGSSRYYVHDRRHRYSQRGAFLVHAPPDPARSLLCSPVAPAFRDEPEGKSILGRYRAELIFFSALALAAFVAGTAWLCVGFVSTGTFLQLVASFIAFFLDFLGEQAMNALSSSIFDLRLGSWHDRESIDEVLFVAKCRLR
jgi:hypothetical protein